MTKEQIETMYQEILGYVTCPHGVYLPGKFCWACGEAIKKECAELALAAGIYGEGK